MGQPLCESVPRAEPPRHSHPLTLAGLVEPLSEILRGKLLQFPRRSLLPSFGRHHPQRFRVRLEAGEVGIEEAPHRLAGRRYRMERGGEFGVMRPEADGFLRASDLQIS